MSSMIRMNNAHDEKISFWPASGSVVTLSAIQSLALSAESPLTAIFWIRLIVGLAFYLSCDVREIPAFCRS